MINKNLQNELTPIDSDFSDEELFDRALNVLGYLIPDYKTRMNFTQCIDALDALRSIASKETIKFK
jgi:hypothetical protein